MPPSTLLVMRIRRRYHMSFNCVYILLLAWALEQATGYDIRHDDVIKCKYIPRFCPFVQGIHRWPVNSPHKGQWRGALMFSLICAWINSWVNNREAGNLKRHRAHNDVIAINYHAVSRMMISKQHVMDFEKVKYENESSLVQAILHITMDHKTGYQLTYSLDLIRLTNMWNMYLMLNGNLGEL